jgi:DNA-binding GntR family transcriptional regulator
MAIRNAVARHDVPSAGAAMREHLSKVILDLDLLRRQNPDFFA